MLPPHAAEVGQLKDLWPSALSITLIPTRIGMTLNTPQKCFQTLPREKGKALTLPSQAWLQ